MVRELSLWGLKKAWNLSNTLVLFLLSIIFFFYNIHYKFKLSECCSISLKSCFAFDDL